MRRMFDTNAVSALVHHRRGFERLAIIADSPALDDRLIPLLDERFTRMRFPRSCTTGAVSSVSRSSPIRPRSIPPISTITLSELETTIAKTVDPDDKFGKVRLVLAQFNIVDFGEAAALHVGAIRAHLEPRGLASGPPTR